DANTRAPRAARAPRDRRRVPPGARAVRQLRPVGDADALRRDDVLRNDARPVAAPHGSETRRARAARDLPVRYVVVTFAPMETIRKCSRCGAENRIPSRHLSHAGK